VVFVFVPIFQTEFLSFENMYELCLIENSFKKKSAGRPIVQACNSYEIIFGYGESGI
jgi:hypothetical protein